MYDYKNKENNVKALNKHMLLKTLSMFKYENLPDTLSSTHIEKQLQTKGYTFITEIEGKLYSFAGVLCGELNVYDEPTQIIINSPALKFNATLSIEDDGVLIRNDDLLQGLNGVFDRYNTLLVENEITMFIASYNARIQTLLSAGDDTTKESAMKYLDKIVAGDLGIVAENRFFDGIRTHSTTSNGNVNFTQLIEFNQYVKAGLFNEVGLNANFNMKRERLNSSEVDLNSDNLFPLIDNMYKNRHDGIQRLNEKYGLNVEFDFYSSWGNKSTIDDDINKNDRGIDEPTIEVDEPTSDIDEPTSDIDEPTIE